MASGVLTDQQLIIHAFAPTDGPHAQEACAQVREVWARCRDLLGITAPIAKLPATLPPDLGAPSTEPTLAALEDSAALRQMILRREHDVLNFSILFTAPEESLSRRRRIGSASPPGWVEFDRWWDELAEHGTSALLGVVRLYLAQTSHDSAAQTMDVAPAVRTALPPAEEAPFWWDRGQVRPEDFAVWEWAPHHDARPERRIAVVGRIDRDPQLFVWTWSNGQPALPPLARYLMHAAKIRHQARVWGDGQDVAELRRRLDDCVEALRRTLVEPRSPSDRRLADQRLQVEEANLATTIRRVIVMRRAVEIAVENMTKALAEPLQSDISLAEWLVQALEDAATDLHEAQQEASKVGEIVRRPWRTDEPTEARAGSAGHAADDRPLQSRTTSSDGEDDARSTEGLDRDRGHSHRHPRITIRMGFGVDIVGYSARSAPAKDDAQQRLATMISDVLDDLDVRLDETDRQDLGDGMKVFLPQRVELHRALPRLIQSWQERLTWDNQQRYRDRLRLRISFGVGPTGVAAIGRAGPTVVELDRLLNSDALRQAMTDHPDADLAALVSNQLYEWVVGEGHPGLDPQRFQPVQAKAKDFSATAWLWVTR